VPGGIVQSIGRGYSDFTASLLAAGVGAHELQIWKQVDGIFSADPTRVPSARLLPSISPAEAAELTYYGAEVIHPFTMEQAIQAAIPIRIKNTFKPNDHGPHSPPPTTGGGTCRVLRAKAREGQGPSLCQTR
jgi:aspartate kinase